MAEGDFGLFIGCITTNCLTFLLETPKLLDLALRFALRTFVWTKFTT